MIKKSIHFLTLICVLVVIALTSCASDFEKIRLNGDKEVKMQKAFEYFENGDYIKARTLFELLLNETRGQAESERIYFSYAYTFYHTRNFVTAASYFENFSTTFVNSPMREEAEFMTAYSYYKQSPSYRLEQSNTNKAMDKFQFFVNKYPRSARVEEVNSLMTEMRQKLEDKVLYQGKLYFDLRDYISAVSTFDNLLKDFPDTKKAEEVRFLIVQSHFQYADNSFYTFQKERFEETLVRAALFQKKYPNSSYAEDVQKIVDYSENSINEINNGYQVKSSGN